MRKTDKRDLKSSVLPAIDLPMALWNVYNQVIYSGDIRVKDVVRNNITPSRS